MFLFQLQDSSVDTIARGDNTTTALSIVIYPSDVSVSLSDFKPSPFDCNISTFQNKIVLAPSSSAEVTLSVPLLIM